jgi:phage terminase large subunit-like protein
MTAALPSSASATPPVMSREVLEMTLVDNPYVPHLPTERQILFLELECLDALYGGAAGGGKSDALLMAALQFATVPGYAALLLRRTFADLKLPGALIDRSREWLTGKAHWNAQEHRWRFPRGGTLQFGYADHVGDEERYRSSEFQFIGLDEATQFTENQIRFLFSRLRRRVGIPVPLRYRLGTNPGGPGHEFVKARYIDPGTPGKAFVPAKVADNPHIDQEQYLTSLAELDPLTRAQLVAGDWDAVAGGRFRREWFGRHRRDPDSPDFRRLFRGGAEVERFKPAQCVRFQTCDPAASTSDAADYFVLSTWLVTPKANVVWWACERGKFELPEQVELCQRSYRRHLPQFVAVEEVMNQRGLSQLLRRSRDPVMSVRGVSPLGRDKLSRAAGFINLCYDGRVFLPEGDALFPTDEVVGELTRFTGDPDQDAHDDIVDTGSYAAELLPMVSPTGGGRPAVYTPRPLR